MDPKVDPKELRRLAAEVDEEHRATLGSLRDELQELVSGPEAAASAPSRRSFLRRVGLGGLIGGAALAVAAPASAQTSSSTTSGTSTATGATSPSSSSAVTTAAGATTTNTSLPQRPTAEDLTLIGFANSVELAVVDAYGLAAATGKISSDVLGVLLTFREHHRQHANAWAGLAGRGATNTSNKALVNQFAPQIQSASSEQQLLEIAYTVENAAAASYAALAGTFKSADAVHQAVAIGPIEARHAVVLGTVLGKSLSDEIPVLEPITGLDPAKYPTGG